MVPKVYGRKASELRLFPALSRALLLAAALVVLLWFLDAAMLAVLFSMLAVILGITLGAPVSWLERRGWPRWRSAR